MLYKCFVNVCECSIHARSMHARQSISSQNAHGGYAGYGGILIMCHIADLTSSEFEWTLQTTQGLYSRTSYDIS